MEFWHKIEGFEEYEVSDLGRVRGARGFLKPRKVGKGYLQVTLRTTNQIYLHRLVASAFVPNPLNLPQVNHLDKDKTNCAASNLEWANGRENVSHGVKHKGVSKFAGVYWKKERNRWTAQITHNRKRLHLGYYLTEEEAHQAYLNALEELNHKNVYA